MPDLPIRKGSLRKPSNCYSDDAIYFVTFKVHNNNCFLGQVIDGVVDKSAEGEITELQWLWLAQHYPYVILHKFIVMPDHVHAIIEIDHEAGVGYDLSLECKIKPLSELIGSFKTTSTKKIRQEINPKFEWQRSFHDHIIRNEHEYNLISEYIKNNPEKWQLRRDTHGRDRSRPVRS